MANLGMVGKLCCEVVPGQIGSRLKKRWIQRLPGKQQFTISQLGRRNTFETKPKKFGVLWM